MTTKYGVFEFHLTFTDNICIPNSITIPKTNNLYHLFENNFNEIVLKKQKIFLDHKKENSHTMFTFRRTLPLNKSKAIQFIIDIEDYLQRCYGSSIDILRLKIESESIIDENFQYYELNDYIDIPVEFYNIVAEKLSKHNLFLSFKENKLDDRYTIFSTIRNSNSQGIKDGIKNSFEKDQHYSHVTANLIDIIKNQYIAIISSSDLPDKDIDSKVKFVICDSNQELDEEWFNFYKKDKKFF